MEQEVASLWTESGTMRDMHENREVMPDLFVESGYGQRSQCRTTHKRQDC